MKTSSTLTIAAILLLATIGVARAEGAAPTAAGTSADCNRVFKAKADAGKDVSTKQLAHDLQLPIATVQKCLRQMRRAGPRKTPRAAQ